MYEPINYWVKYGEDPTTLKDPGRVPQENQIVHLLKSIGPFKSFLDLGCGFGRVMHLVLENFPDVEVVHGVDVSQTRLLNAMKDCGKYVYDHDLKTQVSTFPDEFMNFTSRINGGYDVVFSCEVIMHAYPKDFKAHIGKTIDLSNKHIINIDWWETETPTYEIAEWNFMHPYPEAYQDFIFSGKIKQMKSYNIGAKQFMFHSVK